MATGPPPRPIQGRIQASGDGAATQLPSRERRREGGPTENRHPAPGQAAKTRPAGQGGNATTCRHRHRLLTSKPPACTPPLPSGPPRPRPGRPAAVTHADGDAEHPALVVPVELRRLLVALNAAVGAERRHGRRQHAPACQRFKPPRFRVRGRSRAGPAPRCIPGDVVFCRRSRAGRAGAELHVPGGSAAAAR